MKIGIFFLSATMLLASAGLAVAQKNYGPGVTDTEIKLGQTQPYSGPVSAAGVNGKAMAAYFDMINAKGGVNGRKITLLSLDDGYSPPRTVEQTRKLVEEENVLAVVGSLGAPTNAVVQQYLNQKKVPQILVLSGANRFNDPKQYPYTVPFYPSYSIEGAVYAQYILQNKPNAKIAVLYQNDDFGKDFVQGFRAKLGAAAGRMIVGEASYETSDPTVDSQIIALQASGADTLADFTTQKFGSLAVRKVYDIGWRPLTFIDFVSSSVGAVLRPAGIEKAVGLITAAMVKDPTVQPPGGMDKDVSDYLAFMKQWYPGGDPSDSNVIWAYINAELATLILQRCGDDLSRDNLLKQTTSISGVALPMLMAGIKITITPDDYAPVHQLQLMRFGGEVWAPFGQVISVGGAAK